MDNVCAGVAWEWFDISKVATLKTWIQYMICININFIRSMKKNSLLPNFKYLDYPEWLIQAQAGQIRVTNNFTHD